MGWIGSVFQINIFRTSYHIVNTHPQKNSFYSSYVSVNALELKKKKKAEKLIQK